jgi:uncharacterized protein (DUF1015 family)
MPEFVPFRGLLYDVGPARTDVSALVAPPYDVVDEERRVQLEHLDEHNAIHLTLPRDDRPGDRYARAGDRLRSWLADGVLVPDDRRAFYVYRVEFDAEDGGPRTMAGVVGALAVTPPGEGDVQPHERTMPKPKSDRLDLLRATRANLEPIWGLTLSEGFSDLLDMSGPCVLESVDRRGARHQLRRLVDPDRVAAVSAAVGSSPLVIADGHHRYETSLRYRDEARSAGGGPGPHDRIMALVVELSDEQLVVRPIHRVLGRLPAGFDLRAALERWFELIDLGPNETEIVEHAARQMAQRDAMALVDPSGIALLLPRPSALDALLEVEPEAVRGVDATRFEVAISPLLDAEGVAVTYRHARQEVADTVRKGDAGAAVLLRPVDVGAIRRAAGLGIRMPQKTTFFHPKPSSGLVMRSLDLPEPALSTDTRGAG